MKRICAYMMAALLALSSVFCPAIPVLAEGEEIIDASGYGTMVENVLFERFPKLQVESQVFVAGEATEDVTQSLVQTLSKDEYNAYSEFILNQEDTDLYDEVSKSSIAPLVSFDSDNNEEPNQNAALMMASLDDEIATIAANTSVAGLKKKKKVLYDSATGKYTVQLEAYTTGNVTTTTKYLPSDIVLVLDLSGSMNSNVGDQSRLETLRSAAKAFVTEVRAQAKAHKVDHRIAIVTFGDGEQYHRLYDNHTLGLSPADYNKTGLYYWTGTTPTFRKYTTIGNTYYQSAFITLDSDANRNAVNTLLGKLTTDGSVSTHAHYGMNMAKELFDLNSVDTSQRSRVVVLFSDGGPGWNSRWFDSSMAHSAVNHAKTIKNTYKATIYTIGLFDGANNSTAGIEPPAFDYKAKDYKQSQEGQWVDGVKYAGTEYYYDKEYGGKKYSYNEEYKQDVLTFDAYFGGDYNKYCNWFLQNISSNNGKVQGEGYYLVPTETNSLNDIFEGIANTVSKPTVSMSTDTIIKDYTSKYFKLPANVKASDVVVKRVPYNGNNKWGSETNAPAEVVKTVDKNTGEVTVSGFNFNYYFVSENTKTTGDKAKGSKLVIRFPIEAKDEFLGGNNVPTNDQAKSGIYSSGTESKPLATFPLPTANVPIKVPDFAVQDKTVYYGTQVTPDELYTPYAPTAGAADYVNITYVKPDQAAISSANCTENLEYKIQVVAKNAASSSSVGTAQPTTVTAANTKAKTANVHVLVPEKTYNDTSIYLGQTADYTNNGADTAHTWIDQKGHTTYPAVTGTAPEVVFTYNPAEGAFETDTAVNVTATIDGAEATNAVSFKWTDCTANHGSWPKIETPHLGSVDTPEFYVHILNNSLTITKTGLNAFVYDSGDNESAIFTVVEKGGKNRTWTVPINGNGSVTLDGLYAGATYTVTEQNGWTWRYKDLVAHIMVLKPGTENAFTFANELEENKWLGGDNYENNVFGN